MGTGILIVEPTPGNWQIVGEVSSVEEAMAMLDGYATGADPNHDVAPEGAAVIWRDARGMWTQREEIDDAMEDRRRTK